MSIEALSGKVYLLVTGASRGIGKQIAISLGSVLEKGSRVLLLARNLDGLKETAKCIPAGVLVNSIGVDLAKVEDDELHEIVMQSLNEDAPEEFDRVVVVHNAGTMGNISQGTNSLTDMNTWRSYFDMNVFSPAVLNGVVMGIFNEKTNTKKTIINITSLFAIKPTNQVGEYCTGKAAREMFFKVFALENPEVNVLNYSPGPVETDMFHRVCKEFGNKELKSQFNEMLEKKTYLTCEQTVNRLINVLKDRKYKSGDHVDYFDEL